MIKKEIKKSEVNYKKIVNSIKKSINNFSYDFDSPRDFMRSAIDAVYGKHKSAHAAKILRELFSDESDEYE